MDRLYMMFSTVVFLLYFLHVIGQQLGDYNSTVTHDNLTVIACAQHFCGSDESCSPNMDGLSCQCDYACQFFHDCCFDRNFVETCSSLEDAIAFYDAIGDVQLEQFRCLRSNWIPQLYLYVATCPTSWDNDAVRKRCEIQIGQTFSIDSVPLSHDNYVTYKNVHCAICNGVDLSTLTPWKTGLQCPYLAIESYLNRSVSFMNLIESGDCFYGIEIPMIDGPALRKCLTTERSECPSDTCPQLAQACSSFKGLVSTPHTNEIYRNIFCYFCNQVQCLDQRTYFSNETYYSELWCDVVKDIAPPPMTDYPISVLFDFSPGSGVKVIVNEEVVERVTVTCSRDEVFDPFVVKCLKLSCGVGYELVDDGQCLRIVSPVSVSCASGPSDVFGIVANLSSDFTSTYDGETLRQCITDNIFVNLDLTSLNKTGISHNNYANTTAGNMSVTFFLQKGGDTYEVIVNNIEIMLADIEVLFNLVNKCRIESLTISYGCPQLERQCSAVNGSLLVTKNYAIRETLGKSYIYIDKTDALYHISRSFLETVFRTLDGSVSSKVTVCHIADYGLSCRSIIFNDTLFATYGDEGQLIYIPTGDVIQSYEYISVGKGSIRVCEFLNQTGSASRNVTRYFFQYSYAQVCLSYVCMSLSMLALFVTFIVYCFIPELRKLVCNRLIMILCLSLFIAQLLLLIGGPASSNSSVCTFIAILAHFFWLSAFSITTTLAVDLARTLGARDTIRFASENMKSLLIYLTIAFGVPASIVVICMSLAFTMGDALGIWYGNSNVCWIGVEIVNLIAFGGPVAIVLVTNAVFFVYTIYGISENQKASSHLRSGKDKNSAQNLRIYVKISTLMGFTWVFGFVAAFVNVDALWFIFIILNALQGVYIFCAFILNKRVWISLKAMVHRRKSAKGSQLSSSSGNRTKKTESSVVNPHSPRSDPENVELKLIQQ